MAKKKPTWACYLCKENIDRSEGWVVARLHKECAKKFEDIRKNKRAKKKWKF